VIIARWMGSFKPRIEVPAQVGCTLI
jgi:hypothetical protein